MNGFLLVLLAVAAVLCVTVLGALLGGLIFPENDKEASE